MENAADRQREHEITAAIAVRTEQAIETDCCTERRKLGSGTMLTGSDMDDDSTSLLA